jgi:diguanylate cyclase (GGDEF)-like protein
MGAVYATGEARAVRDYRTEVERPLPWTTVVSAAAVPLVTDGETRGVLSALHHSERVFEESDLELLTTVGAQVAPALTNMKLLAAAHRRAAEALALATLMRTGAGQNRETALQLIGEDATRLLGADVAGVVLHDPAGGMEWSGVYGARTERWRDPAHRPSGPIYFSGERTLLGENGTMPDPCLANEDVQTALILPLHGLTRTLGALVIGWRFQLDVAPAHVEFAEALAGFVGTLVEQASTAAQRDALIGNAPVVLASMDSDGTITLCEGAAAASIGFGPEIVGLRYDDVLQDAPDVIAAIRQAVAGGPVAVTLAVGGRDFDIRFQPRGGGGFLIATDVTERVAAERALQWRATHDELTGLPNGDEVIARTARALASTALGAVVADVRSFDDVNETLGHDAADGLLQEIGRRLVNGVEGAVVVGRTGGDEFTVVAPARGLDGARALAGAVRANAEADTVIDERTLAVEVRCGVAYAEPGDDAEALLRRADSALQSARRGQGMVVAHDAAMADRRRAQVELAADLRRALDDDLLEVHFQPIVDLADRAVQRAEALVRWHHPERGDVPPTEFVGIAERSGLIHRLTATVLDLALERCAGRLGLGVNVNVSALDATSDLLIAQTEAALGRHGIAPEMLCLEITESARLEEEPATIERLPAAQLKLDRAFVGRMCADGRSAAIVRSAVTLAQALGLEIVAEGIEDQATREALTALGCRYGQGFLFAPAMPVDGLAGFVKNGR